LRNSFLQLIPYFENYENCLEKVLFIVLVRCVLLWLFAQPPPPPEDTDPPVPGLSINEDVFVLFIAAILLGFISFTGIKNKKTQSRLGFCFYTIW
jgi:hypothetical protein